MVGSQFNAGRMPAAAHRLGNTMDSASLLPLVKELGIGTLLGTIIGWSLNQWNQRIALRRDRRKALGRTLSDLLEIRHLVLAVPSAIKTV